MSQRTAHLVYFMPTMHFDIILCHTVAEGQATSHIKMKEFMQELNQTSKLYIYFIIKIYKKP